MRRAFRFLSVTLALAAMTVSGCVSSAFRTDWKDPTYRGTFRKLVVICLVREPVIRNTLEDDLAAQFKSRGVEAVQSYTLLPSLENIDPETVRATVRGHRADGVLLVRRIGKETVELGPNQFSGFNYYEQWGGVTQQAFQAPYVNTVDAYKVETSLFEAAQGMVVWQALSDTYDDDSLQKIVSNFALLIVKKIGEQGLI